MTDPNAGADVDVPVPGDAAARPTSDGRVFVGTAAGAPSGLPPHVAPNDDVSRLPARGAAADGRGPVASSSPAASERPETWQHRAEYRLLRLVLGGLSRLPWRRAVAIGGAIGRAGYRPLGIRRDVVEAQIAESLPELPAARVREIAVASYESLGRTTVEAALLPELGRQGVLDLFAEVEGWDVLEAARAEGKGVIVVTGHLGNWEIGGSYVAARGIPIDGIARQMANPRFDRFLTSTREDLGMRVVWDGEAVRRTPRALKEGRVVAFLSDQGALGLASTWVPFFGRVAKTPRGPAVFALRLGTPVLFAVSIRRPDGRFTLHFERVPVTPTGDRERDIDTIVASYTSALERWVRRFPEQYFWQHRRWKHQPSAEVVDAVLGAASSSGPA